MAPGKFKFTDSRARKTILSLARKSGHRALAIWAADCAARVLHFFEDELPWDDRPRIAIGACREWARTGKFRMADVRRTSLAAHAAARTAGEDGPARFAARSAGQAMAAAHVKTHSIAAAWYAAKAIAAADPGNAGGNVGKERDWQYRRLKRLARLRSWNRRMDDPGNY